MLQKLRFNDEVVVVTGAAGGIGRATAVALAELGATTVLVGRTQAKLEEVKAALGKAGAKSEAFAADVSNEADVARLRDFVKQTWGRAKAVVNNAGNNFISPIADLSTQKWRELIAVDLDSIFYMCRAFIPLLLETKNPSILNVALDLRPHRQHAHAGLLRGQGRRRLADAAACRRLWREGLAREFAVSRTHAVAARQRIFRQR